MAMKKTYESYEAPEEVGKITLYGWVIDTITLFVVFRIFMQARHLAILSSCHNGPSQKNDFVFCLYQR